MESLKRHIIKIIVIELLLLVGSSPNSFGQIVPFIDSISTVSPSTSTGDGSNSWGGHQCSIVRTSKGKVYTVYTVVGSSDLNRIFKVALKTGDGWEIVAQGDSGREPAQILVAPDDRTYVICWPNGYPKLWMSDVNGLNFISSDIPGSWSPSDNWPYFSTGIDQSGTLYVLTSSGGKPGRFKLAYRNSDSGIWSDVKNINIDYRYCYTYLVPQTNNGLYLASLRDVVWNDLGFTQPTGAFDYCFNAVKTWYSNDINLPFSETLIHEEVPTQQYPNPNISFNYNGDFYVDTHGRAHVICPISGESTGGTTHLTHYILDRTDLITSVELPSEIKNARLIQNRAGKFFLITFTNKSIVVYPASDANGIELEKPSTIDLFGYFVQYSNLHLGAPRGGVKLSNSVDIVFPSGISAEKWVYLNLHLQKEGPTDSTLLQKKSIEVYPNPVTNHLFIKGLEGITKVEIFNIWGNKVLCTENMYNEINIGNLTAGVYIVYLENNNEIIVKKIIKH